MGDIASHCCRKEIFESDDSDVGEDPEKIEDNMETNPPDTERPLNEEKSKPYFNYKALPKPLHDKPMSLVPASSGFDNLTTMDGKELVVRSDLRLARQNTNDLVRKFENKLSSYGKKGYHDRSNSSGFTSSDNINTKKTNATSSHLETIKESKREHSNYSPRTFEGKSRGKFW